MPMDFMMSGSMVLGEGDDDEDLLQNFDGIPKQSIIDKLDQHRESIKRPENFQFRSQRNTLISKAGGLNSTLASSENANDSAEKNVNYPNSINMAKNRVSVYKGAKKKSS